MEKDSRKEVVSNLPNTLSLFRMVCIPIVILCLYFPGRWGSFLAALFLVSSISSSSFLNSITYADH